MQLNAPKTRSWIALCVLVATLEHAYVHAQPMTATIAQAQRLALPATAPKDAPSSSALSVRAATDVGAYADTDHVYVFTPSLSGTVADPVAGWSVGGQYLVDAVSAASVDIVATASRRWPEIRHAGAIDAAYKPGAFGVAGHGNVSIEGDYSAWNAGAVATQDLLDQNVTLLFGFSHGHDIAGRTGTPFSVFSRKLDREALKAGVTLVADAATLATFLLDASVEHGDPSKPYRYVPLFEPGTTVPLGASVDLVNQLRVSARPLEQLPLTRDRFALSGSLLHRFEHSTLRAEQRAYADTWALFASTSDARWLFDWGERIELGPHVRVHAQSAVNFWQRAYVLRPNANVPAPRTGDRELGALVGTTVGGTLRFRLGPRADRDQWRLGLDLNLTETSYLDALYIKRRLAAFSALSLEARL
jgi:hypothetical protein